MADEPRTVLRLADLATRKPTRFDITPDAAVRDRMAQELGIVAIRKLRIDGMLTPVGRSDWTLEATLGATIVQECVVTLDPVTTRIDEPVQRNYIAGYEDPDAAEAEMPEDDTTEALPASVDLLAVAQEALSLALPPFPRADGAALGEAVYSEPDVAPMTDEDAKPFAGLGALKAQLSAKTDDKD
ncbi:YceD family protein [Yoonia sp. 208BN28-4]|uniref:YceD family protein n=1 Tax=Yoonia sp. 208BN28-4 TaxID=3126505 RepID=UPI0030B72FE6